jgi:THO complex subunit 7
MPCHSRAHSSIKDLEDDMAAIQHEQDAKARLMQAQRAALHAVVGHVGALRLLSKDVDLDADADADDEAGADTLEAGEEREAPALNPGAPPFVPPTAAAPGQQRVQQLARPDSAAPPSRTATPLPATPTQAPATNDVEMGEVAEVKARRKKPRDEELEEGEATDGSSELSDPPDDA